MSKDEIKKNTEWWRSEFYKYSVIKNEILMERFIHNHFNNIEFYFYEDGWEQYNLKVDFKLEGYKVVRAIIPLYRTITYYELKEIIEKIILKIFTKEPDIVD